MTNVSPRLVLSTLAISLFLALLLPTISLGQRPNPRKVFGPPPGTDSQEPRPIIITPSPSPLPVIITPRPPIPVPPFIPPGRPSHSEHPFKVTNVWRSPLNLIWNCKLNRQPCDLKNGINFIPFETDNRSGKETIVADLSKATQIFDGRMPQTNPKLSFKASRLWTKNYFPATYRNACLYLSYSMSGQYRKQMYVMQRNEEDVCVYSAEHGGIQFPNPITRWIDAQIQLDLRYGDARFVLDFEYDLPSNVVNYQETGMVDIRNFSIAYGNCLRNDGNECDSLQDINQP
ncbi:uncharacterized protein LOC124491002 [Dermatophagoides farinae]|uniref:uncharacterized protein LOC124491002 n=1 Tax=Dermatophagoides farinae TaxID=6954 RepID=UPI003F5DAC7F